jgi:hypothetical protein
MEERRRKENLWPLSPGSNFAHKYPLFMSVALVVIWMMAVLVVGKIAVSVIEEPRLYGQDSHAYWLAAQGELAYSRPAGTLDAYLYSPAFLLLIMPLTWLPWPVFLAVWTALLLMIAIWLVKPLRWRWAVPLFIFCLPEILVSNIYLLLSVAAVLGVRHSVAWVFPVLTKVTMGVGLLWFILRGDWRRFLQGISATGVIVGVCYALDPAAWHAWVQFLVAHRDGTKDGLLMFAIRCLLAVILVTIGARRNWPWLIAPAMLLASPILVSIITGALLVAIPRMVMAAERSRSSALTPMPQRTISVSP